MVKPWEQQRIFLRKLLREQRVACGLTQAELAARLGKPQSFVSKIESGDRGLDFVEVRDYCFGCGLSLASFVEKFELVMSQQETGW
ncbi:MAG: hypothetical protein B7Y40_03860 [Gammaproteobacteria bacterium 28-57-27]|nr:MAG: hypothetical protein B7Y40_03860 [Gammaproteobacteria bacterium 28-57-27]